MFRLWSFVILLGWLNVGSGRAASTIQFAAVDYSGSEGTEVRLLLTVDPPLVEQDGWIAVARTGGAASGSDFAYARLGFPDSLARLTIPAGASNRVVWLDLLDDGLPEQTEMLELTVTRTSEGLFLGDVIRASVEIVNAGPRFDIHAGWCWEADGFATIEGYRLGDTNIAFNVDYYTVATGSAIPGVHFALTNGTITVGSGERFMTLRIPVFDDGVPEGDRHFGVYFTNASAGVQVPTETVMVGIGDSQLPTTLDLSYRPPDVVGSLVAFAPDGATWCLTRGRTKGDRLLRLSKDGGPVVDWPVACDGVIEQLLIQSDQTILLIGRSSPFSTLNGTPVPRPGFARLFPDGRLDPNFVPAALPASSLIGEPLLAILADGDYVVSDGSSFRRLKPDGRSAPDFPVLQMAVQALTVDRSGRLVIAEQVGSTNLPTARLLRLQKTGEPDRTFSPAEVVGVVASLLPQPDGRLLAIGRFRSQSGSRSLLMLRADGTSDASFDAGVVNSFPYIPGRDGASARVVQDSNKLIVVNAYGGVYRLNPDGSLDRVFSVKFSGDPASIDRVMLHDSRLLVAGGFGFVNEVSKPGLARLLLDDAPASAVSLVHGTDEYPWGVEWNPSGYEGMGAATIMVRRFGDVRQSATVEYVVRDGSARAGMDYESTMGMLTFAPFESERTIVLPIRDDDEVEPEETMEIQLNAVSGVTVLAPTTVFSLFDDEVSATFEAADPPGSAYCVLKFNSVPGKRYLIQSSSNLREWHFWDSGYGSAEGVVTIEVELLDSIRFFRVEMLR